MARVVVTGGNGFVGRHLVTILRERGDDVIVAGRRHDGIGVDYALDLGDDDNVRGLIESTRPGVIYHLAAVAFVPDATHDPMGTYETNIMGTARLFEAVRTVYRDSAPPRCIFVSSAEVYGTRAPDDYPLRETLAPRPATPYAASKLAGEAIALGASRTFGIPTIVTRAFNHIGLGQDPRFAVPSFARGLAAVAGGAEPILRVGNLSTRRDFLDVRDVVSAYVALADDGLDGEIYNICSGRPISMTEILRELISIAHVAVEVRESADLMRPSDNPLSYGDNTKLQAVTRWKPCITLAQSLRDVYAEAATRAPLENPLRAE
jgi:GDP-4-dehydro-6-deoxy-D-mannose reductase